MLSTSLLIFFFIFKAALNSSQPCDGLNEKISVERILASLPSEEVKALNGFFRELYLKSGFAYTLLGVKPITCIDYSLEYLVKTLPDKRKIHTIADAYIGSSVWAKHKSNFNTPNFELFSVLDAKKLLFTVVLIHKKKVAALLEIHKQVLKPTFENVEAIVNFFKQGATTSIGDYHSAMGILFGYGFENSKAFSQREKLLNYIKKAPLDLSHLNETDASSLSSNMLSLASGRFKDYTSKRINKVIKQLNQLRNKFIAVGKSADHALSPISFPKFYAFDTSNETLGIKHSFNEAREQAIDIYFSENFLEKILILLAS